MVLSILNKKQRVTITQQDNGTQILTIDATINETHTGNAMTTDHPVEDGADITDHLRRTPEELTIVGIVSDTPILFLASLRATPSITGGSINNRAQDAYGFLKDIKDNGRLVLISTTLRDYNSMALTALQVPRDAQKGNIVELNVTFREIIIATTETAEAPEPEPTADGRKKKSNLGKKTKPPTAAPVAAKSQSLLAKIFSSVGSF